MLRNISNDEFNRSMNPLKNSAVCHEILAKGVVEGTNGVLLTVAYGASMLFILIANTALIYGLMKTNRRKYTTSTKYFLVLSATDMLCAITFIPVQLYVIWHTKSIPCSVTGLRAFFSVFPLTLSGMIIMVLTIDRYDTVKVPTRAKRSQRSYTNIIAFVLIAISVSAGWGVWYTMSTRERSFKKASVFFICLASFEACVLLTVVIFNALIFYRVKESSKNTSVKSKSRLAEKRLSKTILLISGTLVVTYLPSVIGLLVAGEFFHSLTLMDVFSGKVTQKHINNIVIGLIWSLLLSLVNSGLNASIYMARNKRIIKMFISMYTHRKQKIFAKTVVKSFYPVNPKTNIHANEPSASSDDEISNDKNITPMNTVNNNENNEVNEKVNNAAEQT